MHSLITGGTTTQLFETRVLGKYDVSYFRCDETGFIQTETPYWLDEAYNSAITALDIGLLSRNIEFRLITSMMLNRLGMKNSKFLDFGAGYGAFVRLMRDWGYDFYHQDPMCENLFARDFEWLPGPGEQATLVTAWEVLEHSPDPNRMFEELFAVSDTILCSTTLVPNTDLKSSDDWWYFIPETGQHVSLFTRTSLEYIASKHGATFYTDGHGIHVLSKRSISNPFRGKIRTKISRILSHINREIVPNVGKLPEDFEHIRKKIRETFTKGTAGK